jgi:hypothetical protein
LVPTDVVGEGEQPAGRVIFAGGIGEERVNACGSIAARRGVLSKRSITDGCVDGTGAIAKKRFSADCRVEGAGNAFDRVAAGGAVAVKRVSTNGRVVDSGNVAKK